MSNDRAPTPVLPLASSAARSTRLAAARVHALRDLFRAPRRRAELIDPPLPRAVDDLATDCRNLAHWHAWRLTNDLLRSLIDAT